MFLFIPKAKEQCSLCNTSFLSENTKSHTHTVTHTHSPFLFLPHSSLSLPHPSFPSPLSFLPPPTYPPLSTPPHPPRPPAIPTTWGDCLTPLRHISPVIIVSTNRESRLTSTGVVSILGGGGVWIVSVFGFEAILVASSCSSKILGRLK